MEIILTHDRADFDGVAAMLAASRLYPGARPVLPARLNYNVAEFITLYQNGLPFSRWEDIKGAGGHIDRIIIVDTQHTPDLRYLKPGIPKLIIDHHPLEHAAKPHVETLCEPVGAVTTLLVERIREQHIPITSLEATLMMLGIYSDTGTLTYSTTTPRDISAAAWLLERKAVLDIVRRFLSSPLNDEQMGLFDTLLAAATSRDIHGYTVIVTATRIDREVQQINNVAHRLREMLEPDALFVLVKMPGTLQLVCRSRSDAIDVGEVARYFGGGGHHRAAAARIEDLTLNAAVDDLWAVLEDRIQPQTRVADLMSYGVQTVNADDAIKDIIQQLRRIGHEGYPVLDGDQVVGLLTRRDADRALEHSLEDATVRDVMVGGDVTLHPRDPVAVLEQLMVNSGWGQIPVVDDQKHLIGVVTRTDLIKHWVRVHPTQAIPDDRIEPERIPTVLGQPAARLIDAVSRVAQESEKSIYMVGGGVRDLLLNRPNYDIDFVVEGDAIEFASQFAACYGGEISSYRPFGTAKLHITDDTARFLAVMPDDLPNHIDFASSRNEFYEHPTALPSVYNSSIKLDLHRRDFTINTLAVQLSPPHSSYRLLDFYGGLSDLRNGVIRVLHSLSFVDDPTRVLRAIRFEQRLNFTIEARTAELIRVSYPMLRRITGERLRNELHLLMKEQEPERGLRALRERGILRAIHPVFDFEEDALAYFPQVRGQQDDWPLRTDDLPGMYLHILMAHIPLDNLDALCERLAFGRTLTTSFTVAAAVRQQPGILADPQAQVSAVVRHLDGLPEVALLAAWIVTSGLVKERLWHYLTAWRTLHPHTDGHTLRARGLPTGPEYRIVLDRLRDAWLNGDIDSAAQEADLLEQLISEVFE